MKNIVTIPCRTIKAMAREMLRGKYWVCLLAVLACHIIAEAPSLIAEAITSNENILLAVELASFVVEVAMTLCTTGLFIRIFRGQDTNLDIFTEPLRLLGKAVIMEFISYVQIFLWSLLFVVPGIICAIKHAQNFYALLDNPEYYPTEAIHRSHELMEGNKWKWFKLQLSFFGWEILAAAPLAIYQMYFGPVIDVYIYFSDRITFEEYFNMINEVSEMIHKFNTQPIPLLLSLIPLFVFAYRSVANAAFYDLAAGNLIVQDEAVQG